MAASETLEPLIGTNALAYYLKRICTFLEGDKKTLSFPKITPELQQLLVRIVDENPEFLASEMFSTNARSEGAKLAAALKVHGNIRISYNISDGKHGPNVLSFTKTEANLFKVPKPLRPPSEAKPALMVSPDDTEVTPIFKTNCLNAATKFVKDDSELLLRFPEMTTEQAEFIRNMILPGIEGKTEQTDVGFGYRSMYAPLWESMRVFSLKYTYKITYDTKPVSKEGMKRLIFEKLPKAPQKQDVIYVNNSETLKSYKIPKLKKADVIVVDNTDTLSSTLSSSSTTSTKSPSKPKSNPQPVVSKQASKLVRKLAEKSLSEQYIHDSLKRISDFLMDDDKKSIVFKQQTLKQLQFLEIAHLFSRETDTYMMFSTECQRYLDNIKYCNNVKGVKYKTKRTKCVMDGVNINTLKDLIMVKIDKSSKSKNQDVEVETISSSSSSNISANTKLSNLSANKSVNQLIPKITSGIISQQFIESSLERMLAFIQEEQQASIMFKELDFIHQLFIQNIKRLCCSDSKILSVFSDKSKQLLADIKNSLGANAVYNQRTCKGGKDVILEKLAVFSKKPKVKENKENVNNMNSSQPPHLLRLKHIKDNISRVSGEQAVLHYLNDVSNFLTRTNMDRSITFDQISEFDCHFLKNVHIISKTDDAYPMFSRECQKLLNNIRFNAQSYNIKCQTIIDVDNEGYCEIYDAYPMFPRECQKLLNNTRFNAQSYVIKCQTIIDVDNEGFWTIILEKQKITPKEKELKTISTNIKRANSIKDLYTVCRKVMDQKEIVQQRARSLSAGRRIRRSEARKAEQVMRSSSIQRPRTVKEKLQAALAQPVKSDKALKMMELMGWKGGALGPRGEGITEPIALPLDLTSRAGFGHVKPAKTKPEPKKSRAKQVPAQSKQQRSVSSTNSATSLISGLTGHDVKPVASLASYLVPPGILPSGVVDKLPEKSKTIFLSSKVYHTQIMRSVLEILTKDIDTVFFVLSSGRKANGRCANFVKHVVNCCTKRVPQMGITDEEQIDMYNQITDILLQRKGLMLRAENIEKKTIAVTKSYLIRKQRTKMLKTQVFTNTYYCKDNSMDKNQEKTTNEIITIDDEDRKTDDEERITANQEITSDNQQISMSCSREWYLPSKNFLENIIKKSESKTTKVMSDLKALTLSKVIELIDATMLIDAKAARDTDATKTQKDDAVTTQNDINTTTQEFETTTQDVDMSMMTKVVTNMTQEIDSIPILDVEMPTAEETTSTGDVHMSPTTEVVTTTAQDDDILTTNEFVATTAQDVDMSTANQIVTKTAQEVDISTTNEFEITTPVDITAMEDIDTSNLSSKMTVQELEAIKTQVVNISTVPDVTTQVYNNMYNMTPIKKVDLTFNICDKTTEQDVEKTVTDVDTTLTRIRQDIDISKAQEIEMMITQEFDTIIKEIDTMPTKCINTPTEPTLSYDERKVIEITKSNEAMNIAKQNRVKTTVRNVTIPSISRRRLNCLNQQGIQTDPTDQYTTYTLRKENYNKDTTNLIVTKSTSEQPILFKGKSKKWKINRQQYIEAKLSNEELKEIPIPLVLLEKYSINNNDLTLNKNKSVKKEKTSVAVRLVNAVKDSDDTIKKKNVETPSRSYNIPDIKTNLQSTSNNTHIIENAPNDKNTASTSNVSLIPKNEPVNVSKIAAKTSIEKGNMTLDANDKISKDNSIALPKNNITDVTENDTETAVYVIPVEYIQTTEKEQNTNTAKQIDKNVNDECKENKGDFNENTVLSDKEANRENETNLNENNDNKNETCKLDGTDKSNLNAEALINSTDKIETNENANKDDEDDDCQIVFEDSLSTIVLNSDDEDLLLTSDEDIEKIKGCMVKTENVSNEDKSEVEGNVIENLAETNSAANDKEERTTQVINQYRKRTSVNFSPGRPSPATKKCKLQLNFKKICIQTKNYPETKINLEKAREIQAAILKSIDSKQMFPLLKCQGIQNGGLVYYCQDEKSLFFLEDLVKSIVDLKLTHEFDDNAKFVHKMAFRINSFIDESACDVLNRLEMYNLGLYCTNWSVIKKEQYGDFSVIHVEIDETSFNYVCDANFILYAGNDCARFTIVWE